MTDTEIGYATLAVAVVVVAWAATSLARAARRLSGPNAEPSIMLKDIMVGVAITAAAIGYILHNG